MRARPAGYSTRELAPVTAMPAPTAPAASTWAASTPGVPGTVNTRWFNTGHTSFRPVQHRQRQHRRVNSGSFNNGALWTGDFCRLVGFSFSIDRQRPAGPPANPQPGPPSTPSESNIPGMSLFIARPRNRRDRTLHHPAGRCFAIPLEIHESIHMDPIVPGATPTIPAQTRTIPLDIPASPGSTSGLPLSSAAASSGAGSSGDAAIPPACRNPFGAHRASPFTGLAPERPAAQDIYRVSDSRNPYHEIPVGREDIAVVCRPSPSVRGWPDVPNAIPVNDRCVPARWIRSIRVGTSFLPLHLALNLTVPDSGIPIIDVPPAWGYRQRHGDPRRQGSSSSGAGGVSRGFPETSKSNLSGWWNQAAKRAGSGSGC